MACTRDILRVAHVLILKSYVAGGEPTQRVEPAGKASQMVHDIEFHVPVAFFGNVQVTGLSPGAAVEFCSCCQNHFVINFATTTLARVDGRLQQVFYDANARGQGQNFRTTHQLDHVYHKRSHRMPPLKSSMEMSTCPSLGCKN